MESNHRRLLAMISTTNTTDRATDSATDSDLAAAEMPEVTPDLEAQTSEQTDLPAPLTVADVEPNAGNGSTPEPVVNPSGSQPPERTGITLTEPLPDPDVPQVLLQTVDRELHLLLPTEKILAKVEPEPDSTDHPMQTWEELLTQLDYHITIDSRQHQPRTQVHLQAGDRLLDMRQLQEISDILHKHDLVLHQITTTRRQTAINGASMGLSVEQGTFMHSLMGYTVNAPNPMADPLYVKATLRSGSEIRHSGSIMVFGDVHAGAELIADGDIMVWGKLRGMAHAGAKGNPLALVMALHLEATQIRIAEFVARVDTPTTYFCPEVAFVNTQGTPTIQIVQAIDYSSFRAESSS
ncbi:MAG: septum site-determining protein MinC [Pseudanabaena sp. ELA607]|jgi:septum site-determining protein MinC